MTYVDDEKRIDGYVLERKRERLVAMLSAISPIRRGIMVLVVGAGFRSTFTALAVGFAALLI